MMLAAFASSSDRYARQRRRLSGFFAADRPGPERRSTQCGYVVSHRAHHARRQLSTARPARLPAHGEHQPERTDAVRARRESRTARSEPTRSRHQCAARRRGWPLRCIAEPYSAGRLQGDWWQLDPSTTRLLLRMVSADWNAEQDPTISIERVDKPMTRARPSAGELEQRLRQIPDRDAIHRDTVHRSRRATARSKASSTS